MTIKHMTLWVRWQKEFFIKWWDKKFKINKHNFSTTLICSTNKSHIYTRVRDYYMTFSISALVLARDSHIKPDSEARGLIWVEGWYQGRYGKFHVRHCTDRHCLVYFWNQTRNKNICKLSKGNSRKDLFSQFVSSKIIFAI
jgi:hypothetical protein